MAELIEEIVRLSLEHGILTEYTAFLATDGTMPMTPDDGPIIRLGQTDTLYSLQPQGDGFAFASRGVHLYGMICAEELKDKAIGTRSAPAP